jgi:cell division protease FtsH
MSEKIGNISFYDSSGQTDFGFTKPYSEKTAEIIDEEVNRLVSESYERAKQVLSGNMKGLTVLAELLLEKEVIFSEDLERIFGKRRAEILREEREAEVKGKEINGIPGKAEEKIDGQKKLFNEEIAEASNSGDTPAGDKTEDVEAGKKESK